MGEHWLVSWALFAGIMALGQFSPGPDMILLTRVSLRYGRRAGWLVTLGIVSGLCFHAALAIGGISILLAQGGWLEAGLRIAAAAYLGWLGWQMIASFLRGAPEEMLTEKSSKQEENFYVKGLLCNLLNPKVLIFFAGMTAQFLQGERAAWWPILLWLTIVVEGLVLWGMWVVALQNGKLRAWYQKGGRWLDLGFGLGLWVLAGLLVAALFRT